MEGKDFVDMGKAHAMPNIKLKGAEVNYIMGFVIEIESKLYRTTG